MDSRRQHSAHGALSYLRDQCQKQGINWIIDADIAKFFDTIEPEHLRTILQQRINDGAILRLIGMWLHVGVMEEGKVVRSETGTPQGGVISPILANIFLHTVLDEWFETTVRPRMAVLIPPRFRALRDDDPDGTQALQAVARAVERFRPLGVELRVEFIDDRWVLGSGTLTSGEGDDPIESLRSGMVLWEAPQEPANA